MEVNKDEALRCLDIGRRHLSSGNYAHARKFGKKSISLFPTTQAKEFLAQVDSREASSEPTRPPSSSARSSPNPSTSPSPSSTTPIVPPQRSKSTPIVDHKPVERDYTPEQAAAVKTIRSSGGDFYKVLGVKKDATDVEIKKAYRKLALQMHPDKNGAPGADEAFKIVSKAFTVLSDPQKRAVFDQHGPDEGRSSSVNYDRARPTAQHYGYAGGGFGEEISPEELFNMFFGGSSFGSSFHSTTFAGPGFGTRSRAQQTQYHQQRQQQFRQQHQQQRQQRQQQQQRANYNNNNNIGDLGSGIGSILQLLPLIILLIVSLTSFLSSDPSSSLSSAGSFSPAMDFSLRAKDHYTTARHTSSRKVPYFVDEVRFMNTFFPGQQFEFKSPGARQLNVPLDHVTVQGKKVGPLFQRMEENVELAYLRELKAKCKEERRKREEAKNRAMSFWGLNAKLWNEAKRMSTPNCDLMEEKYGK
ncbi:hypothetical protein BGX28_003813 [Mortierella sp. GBA30]|nr:hypothetical protein BGX28_003813 [Mortierella sp. GBA30]